MIRPFLPKQEEKHTKTMESSTSGFPHLPQSCDHGNRAELAGGAVPNLFRPGNGPKQLGTGSKRSFKSHDGEILSPRATPKSSKSVDHIITMMIYIYILWAKLCATHYGQHIGADFAGWTDGQWEFAQAAARATGSRKEKKKYIIMGYWWLRPLGLH